VDEALDRGHEVTAVLREPTLFSPRPGETVVHGDVSDAASVARPAAGHDVAISAIGPRTGSPETYAVDIAHALLEGLAQAEVPRLVVVGGAGSLRVAGGGRLLDSPDFDEDWKPGALAAAAALDVFRNARAEVDWVYFSPAGFFDPEGPRTGRYRLGGDDLVVDASGASHLSYADGAVAILDEVENPRHHRERFTAAD
jgi:putative NADH-flavin reductase